MMRRAATAPIGALYPAARDGAVIPVGMQQMTVALFGLAIYLFCVHSFKLPIASVGIGIGVVGVMLNARDVSVPQPLLWMAAFLVWCGVGATMTAHPAVVGQTLLDYLKILLIFFVALNVSRTVSQLGVFAGLWVLMFGLFPARGTYFNFLAGIGAFGRYSWNYSFGNSNDLAAYAILALGLSAFLLAGAFARWLRISALIATGGFALMIVLTQSRGAFIGLVVAFVFMLLRSRSRARLVRFGMLAALGIALIAPGAVWERFSRMKYLLNTETIGEADTSAEQRYVLLQIASSIAKDNLVFGVGLGAYPEAHGQYAEDRTEWSFGRGNRDAHNMYLNLLAETGVIGFALFLGLLGSVLIRAIRMEKSLRGHHPLEAEQLRLLRFGLVAYLIAAIFGSFHRVSFLYLYLAILWSAAQLFESLLTNRPAAGRAVERAPDAGRHRLRGGLSRFGRGRSVGLTARSEPSTGMRSNS